MSAKEIWKDIKNYEGLYQVSNIGRVKRLESRVNAMNNSYRIVKEKMLKGIENGCGYNVVRLSKNGIVVSCLIHRLVAYSFIDNENEEETIINHKDENKKNNSVSNLEWCTRAYNNKYSNSKRIIQFDLHNRPINVWVSIAEVERKLGFANSNISHCCKKNDQNRIWIYLEAF